ncbi:V-type ATP synthase subunit A [Photobacterium sp. DNB23_23_1]|uniref:V-type ATP synthase alpha chain n=1 Tax=Photobacterium pectinilyticum TaxID=2906793 RepID=A0ABT1MZ18_9GAMM|nr:V-type ATP synthase subunit A [Photobacterium sp. ZSDE20]MCQ1057738.1 V-type ATP synthase subunit A [Photobacterium sp. ZSDE20]MDD1822051.1 V-type ATP synthase subunit A [Photobacterium sp. ZSDE20]
MSTELINKTPTAHVTAVIGDTLTIRLNVGDNGQLIKNEVVYVLPSRKQTDGLDELLMAEVLRVRGDSADIQVYEDTRGVAVGDSIIQTGEMLSVDLGPGILAQIYDGLQNPLERLAQIHGKFLKRGVQVDALDKADTWAFNAVAKKGDKLRAGQSLGTVQEGRFTHQIMVPFYIKGEVEVTWIQEGSFTIDTVIAHITDNRGKEHNLTMVQKWPVRQSIANTLTKNGGKTQRKFPNEPLVTTTRTIDTFFPIARGGTGCVPGPFGSGKTVLQHGISRHCDADIVIVVACGERAGEVVETIEEFPHLPDPKHGGTLIDRTVIICNTSSMPVAAREASIYTGLTLGEYYRQMGYNVLLLADSTSRWAQAMRETSNRLEEIPGEEGFPAYMDSAIKGVYERCGVVDNENGTDGSLTMIGSVSPAGGNFEEPVTQSTLGTVKTFLGLSYERAYKRFYPAIDPLISWSRYLDQLEGWYADKLGPEWVPTVKEMKALLSTGDSIGQMMQVTGEEGISLEDYVVYQKALFLDMVYLQQDAFDEVDASCSFERQQFIFGKVVNVIRTHYDFTDKAEARKYFTSMTRYFRNFHYAKDNTAEYHDYISRIDMLLEDTVSTAV